MRRDEIRGLHALTPRAVALGVLLSGVLLGCPRETESHFYGGQPVRSPFGDARPAAAREVPEDAHQGGPEEGVLEGAGQPTREDKAPPEEAE